MRHHILSVMVVVLLSGLVIPRPLVWGFAIATHAEISDAAADQSDLEAPLATLGLNSLDDTVVFLPATGAVHSARKWLQLGSEYEDDLSSLRFRNHFYNPRNGSGLAFSPAFPCSIGGTQSGKPAPNWGLDEGGVNQEYSLKDARDAYYKGLTAPLKDFRDTQQPPEDTRSHHLARMFETLGHVIHLVQDMAQPQHTRNDPHGPWCFGTGSFYEGHTQRNLKDSMLSGYQPVYGSTDTTTFNAPRKFWHGEGKGLAEYTSRGFVTTGTNFDTFPSKNFPEPDLNLATSHDEDMSALCEKIGLPTPPGPNGPLPCVMRFVKTRVIDAYRPGTAAEEENARASTYSIFNADLSTYNEQVTYTDPTTGQLFMTPVLYTLNSLNFDARNEFVIKRAVGYSAGFINYFFRGKIDFVPDTDPANPNGFLIQNLSDEDMDGTFTLYYDDENDNRQGVVRDAGGKAIGWPLVIPAGGEVQAPAFDVPTDPAPKTPGEYMLVFTGTLGEEAPVNGSRGAVVAKSVKPASPFLLVTELGTFDGSANFTADAGLLFGDLWWAGTAGTLSWTGNTLYRDGAVFDTAPDGEFLAAGIGQDEAGANVFRAVTINAATSYLTLTFWEKPDGGVWGNKGSITAQSGHSFLQVPGWHAQTSSPSSPYHVAVSQYRASFSQDGSKCAALLYGFIEGVEGFIRLVVADFSNGLSFSESQTVDDLDSPRLFHIEWDGEELLKLNMQFGFENTYLIWPDGSQLSLRDSGFIQIHALSIRDKVILGYYIRDGTATQRAWFGSVTKAIGPTIDINTNAAFYPYINRKGALYGTMGRLQNGLLGVAFQPKALVPQPPPIENFFGHLITPDGSVSIDLDASSGHERVSVIQ